MKVLGNHDENHAPFIVNAGSLAAFLRVSDEFSLEPETLAVLVSPGGVAAVNLQVAMLAAMTKGSLKDPFAHFGTVRAKDMVRVGSRVAKQHNGSPLHVHVAAALLGVERIMADEGLKLGLDVGEVLYWVEYFHSPGGRQSRPGLPWCPPPGIGRFDESYEGLCRALEEYPA